MLKKFLREVVNIIAGKQAEEMADLLDDKKYLNEFLIAKKLNLTINQTRNILYKISDYGLVSFTRKKDKKKGWYTYFWKIESLKCLEFLRGILIKKIDQIEHQIKSRETKKFYICERCKIELNEENALLHNFTCDECGDILTIKDNTKLLREFKKSLNKLTKKLALVDEEIKKEKQKREKEKKLNTVVKKKVSKKKVKKKSQKRKTRKKAKQKFSKKSSKKQIRRLSSSPTKVGKRKTKYSKNSSPKSKKKKVKKKQMKKVTSKQKIQKKVKKFLRRGEKNILKKLK